MSVKSKETSRLKIKYVHQGYNIARNILNMPGVEYVRHVDFFKLAGYTFYRLRKKPVMLLDTSAWYSGKDAVLFLWNGINYSKGKWCCIYERNMPDFAFKNKWLNRCYQKLVCRRLARENCLKIYAISNWCYRNLINKIEDVDITESAKESIRKKIALLYPPQRISGEDTIHRLDPKKLRLVFVGGDILRKGGYEMLKVLIALNERYSFSLSIVSSLNGHKNPSPFEVERLRQVERWVDESDCIKHYKSLENGKVMELISQSDIGLLPTFQDTFGYSALEMQGCGVPVVTTDIRALADVNSVERGWLLRLGETAGVDLAGDFATVYNGKCQERYSQVLQDELRRVLVSIFENPEEVAEKSAKCYEYIRKEHNPVIRAETIIRDMSIQ